MEHGKAYLDCGNPRVDLGHIVSKDHGTINQRWAFHQPPAQSRTRKTGLEKWSRNVLKSAKFVNCPYLNYCSCKTANCPFTPENLDGPPKKVALEFLLENIPYILGFHNEFSGWHPSGKLCQQGLGWPGFGRYSSTVDTVHPRHRVDRCL